MVVVLPAPLGPMSPKISPSNTSKETSSTATVEAYSLRRWATSMTRLADGPADGGGEVTTVAVNECSGMSADHSPTPRQAQMVLRHAGEEANNHDRPAPRVTWRERRAPWRARGSPLHPARAR